MLLRYSTIAFTRYLLSEITVYNMGDQKRQKVTLHSFFAKEKKAEKPHEEETSSSGGRQGERLNGLALLNIHRDVPVHADDILTDLAKKPRRLNFRL